MGDISILNVSEGDTKITVDEKGEEEFSRIIEDMLKRGYALFIEVGKNDNGPIYQRAHGYDPNTKEYIIAGTPPPELAQEPDTRSIDAPAKKKRSWRKKATEASATAVARSAGG